MSTIEFIKRPVFSTSLTKTRCFPQEFRRFFGPALSCDRFRSHPRVGFLACVTLRATGSWLPGGMAFFHAVRKGWSDSAHIRLAAALALGLALTGMARADDPRGSLQSGSPSLKSIGPLAFGPQGILFVGDPQGAAIFAIDTGDVAPVSSGEFKVAGVDEKIASLLGTKADQIIISDLAVNPLSGNAYLSVSRGKGPDAIPVLIKVDRSEKVSEVPLQNVRFAKTELVNAASGNKAPSCHNPARFREGSPVCRRPLQ